MSRGGAICNGRASSLRPVVTSAHVVELGCGSGWVGQSICGRELRITGTDFSASQIALARENAARKRLDAFTHYQVATSGVWPSLDRAGTGILIHAFLHHLDGAELDAFFDMLHRNVPPGTQIWIYEPAFYPDPPAGGATDPAAKAFAYRAATAIVSQMSTLLSSTEPDRHRYARPLRRAVCARQRRRLASVSKGGAIPARGLRPRTRPPHDGFAQLLGDSACDRMGVRDQPDPIVSLAAPCIPNSRAFARAARQPARWRRRIHAQQLHGAKLRLPGVGGFVARRTLAKRRFGRVPVGPRVDRT